MKYCRINLEQTDYELLTHGKLLYLPPIDRVFAIYRKYCAYKGITGPSPIFRSQLTDPQNDVFGYYNEKGDLVAFSLCRRHDDDNAESIQFGWDYEDKKLGLGIASIKHECAHYKSLGYKYLYLGPTEPYKEKFKGYEDNKDA